MQTFDLEAQGLRALNQALHNLKGQQTNETAWEVVNPKGSHAIAVGVDAPIDITVRGSTGYYCAGMNKQATIRVKGSAGPGVAENLMSGTVIDSKIGISQACSTGLDLSAGKYKIDASATPHAPRVDASAGGCMR